MSKEPDGFDRSVAYAMQCTLRQVQTQGPLRLMPLELENAVPSAVALARRVKHTVQLLLD